VGCTVSPGFDFADFTIAERQALLRDYPHSTEIIEALTRG
jgi:predicted cupin superfamily sugar epimerase